MKSVEFCYWLQGLFELQDPKNLDEKQVDLIKRHLNMVFFHEIDPSYSNGSKLSEIHNANTFDFEALKKELSSKPKSDHHYYDDDYFDRLKEDMYDEVHENELLSKEEFDVKAYNEVAKEAEQLFEQISEGNQIPSLNDMKKKLEQLSSEYQNLTKLVAELNVKLTNQKQNVINNKFDDQLLRC